MQMSLTKISSYALLCLSLFCGGILTANAYTVVRTPTGTEVTSPVNYQFTISKQDYYDEGGGSEIDSANFICFTAQNYDLDPNNTAYENTFLAWSDTFPFDGSTASTTPQDYNFTFNLAVGTQVDTVDYWFGENDIGSCDPQILLYTSDFGISGGSAVEYLAPNTKIFTVVANTTTGTTTIEVDTRPITYGFFVLLWVGTFLLTVFGISKFT